MHFFGVWEDLQAAYDNYLRVAADPHASREPSALNLHPGSPTVKDACNCYLHYQFQKVQSGEIRPKSFEDCRRIAGSLAKSLGATRPVSGLTPTDFQRFRLRISQRGLNGNTKCRRLLREEYRRARVDRDDDTVLPELSRQMFSLQMSSTSDIIVPGRKSD